MTQKEIDLLTKYFYFMEERLEDNIKIFDIRACRKQLDSLDHLEEIIAKERLLMFQQIHFDIDRLLKLNGDIGERLNVLFRD